MARGVVWVAVLVSVSGCGPAGQFDAGLGQTDATPRDASSADAERRDAHSRADADMIPDAFAPADTCVEARYFVDGDGDGHGHPDVSGLFCAPPTGYVLLGDDCDDTTAEIHPGASESCNERDEDCDDLIDEGMSWGVVAGSEGSSSLGGGGRLWALRRAGPSIALSYKTGPGTSGDVQYVQIFDATGAAVGAPLSSTVGSPADIDAPGLIAGRWVVMGRQRSYACGGAGCTYWYGTVDPTGSWLSSPRSPFSDPMHWSGFFAAQDRYFVGRATGSALTIRAFGAASDAPLYTRTLYTSSGGFVPTRVAGVDAHGAVQWIVTEQNGALVRAVLVRADAEGSVLAGPVALVEAEPRGEPVAFGDGLLVDTLRAGSSGRLHSIAPDGSSRSSLDIASDPDWSALAARDTTALVCHVDGTFERIGARADHALVRTQSPTPFGHGPGPCAVVMLERGAFFAFSDNLGNTLRWGRLGCAE